MFLFWKIRYLDRADKQFKDRCLYLNTKTLVPVTRAAVEIVVANRSANTQREILKYRHLFVEGAQTNGPRDPHELNTHYGFCLHDYFEDEAGKEITPDEIAQILTGNPTARAIPRRAKQHDIDLMFAEPKPIPLAEVSLSAEEARLLGYFVRDLEEMQNSAFMKDGPGTLTTSGITPTLTTAVTDDEIRSFVTIFRRLYMEGEPANFKKAVDEFVNGLGDHPYSKWVEGAAKEYETHLAATPDARPFVAADTCTFTTKRLIDVFLYTQYAHQPDAKRQRQFEACLAELNGKRAVLTWMFLTEMWKCALEIGNAGNVISWWFKHYCHHHGVTPDVLKSLREHHAGLGTAEKEQDRRERLFREKVEQLAADLWEQAGRPDSGPAQFLVIAREQLAQVLIRG
ncbi:MAG TPA: hypothetical protein VH682_23825 [Gemmataceae bacterium]|jgi:hypothetical protein